MSLVSGGHPTESHRFNDTQSFLGVSVFEADLVVDVVQEGAGRDLGSPAFRNKAEIRGKKTLKVSRISNFQQLDETSWDKYLDPLDEAAGVWSSIDAAR